MTHELSPDSRPSQIRQRLAFRLSVGVIAGACLVGSAEPRTQSPGAAVRSSGSVPQILIADTLTPRISPTDRAAVLRSRAVRVDVDRLARSTVGARLGLDLFADHRYVGRVQQRKMFDSGFHLVGALEGETESNFVITVVGDGVSAVFSVDRFGTEFEIRGAPGTFVLSERDPNAKSPGSNPLLAPASENRQRPPNGASFGGSCNDDPDSIGVLAVYDTLARTQAGGVSNIQAWINQQLFHANLACDTTELPRKGASMQFTLKGFIDANRAATGTSAQELYYITYRQGSSRDPSGILDGIHTWRERQEADLVLYVVGQHPNRTINKTAWIGGDERFGFSLVQWNAFARLHDAAQVMAYNFGCDRNREATTRNHAYAHGWWGQTNSFYAFSIMSHDHVNRCNCNPRAILGVFSGDKYVINGTVLWSPSHDNRRKILEERQRIANYSLRINGWTGPPTITTQPSNATVHLGYNNPENVTFSVTASRAASYQWRRNGSNISGARGPTLRVDVTNISGSSTYDCLVTNRCGTTTTRAARLIASSATRVLRQASPRANVSYGYRVSNLGDFNADGYSDYGVAGTTLTTTNDGFVRVYSGRTGAELWTVRGGTGDNLGISFGPAGDVNGDGHDDLLTGLVRKGEVRVYSGRTGGLLRRWIGTRFQDFGRFTAGNGDLNGDGVPDVIASGDSLTTLHAWSGKDGSRLWTQNNVPPITALAIVGDTNYDGYDDVLNGDANENNKRGVIELRDGRNATLTGRLRGRTDGDRVGTSFAAIGDVNNDGTADVVVSLPGAFGTRGAVRVYALRSFRQIGSSAIGENVGDFFGFGQVSALGDYNGDGTVDYLASSRIGKYVRVISGADMSVTLRRLSGFTNFGSWIAGIDSNGDKRPDILVGSPNENRAWVYDAGPVNDPPRVRSIFNGCKNRGGRVGRLTVEGRVAIDDAFTLTAWGFDNNTAGVLKIGVQSWGLDLGALGAPGCIEAIRTLANVSLPTNSVGRAQLPIRLANNPTWIGIDLQWQAAALSPGANALASNSSNGVITKIGRQ